MKWKMKVSIIVLAVLVLSFQSACSKSENTSGITNSDNSMIDISLKPYDDIRAIFDKEKIFNENEYSPDDIITFTFNEGTVLKGNENLQDEIMNNGKNPGLDIRKLHEEGITGKGINVAIIDQNLLLHHPEFDGKITEYYDTGCLQEENNGSMHAPAVTSILVGNTIGVAPDAMVYFAAAPSWNGDSEFYAKGLYWIIEENKKLPEDEKIRVVSVSAAPSGDGSPFTKNMNMWDEGTGGFPTSTYVIPSSYIGVPTSYRTVAEEYLEGSPSYQYTGQGGLSWGIPYAAGVLALGWQVNPALDNDQIVRILFETCTIANDGSNIINPNAFIDVIEKTKK